LESPSDGSKGASTLPRPELNPLLNPLLGANMGRWAEVYFTSPPDRREEAVLELLRQLESDNPGGVAVATASAESPHAGVTQPLATDRPRPTEAATTTQEDFEQCTRCGHANPAGHQFCGMCGMQMEQVQFAGAHAREERGHENSAPIARETLPEPESHYASPIAEPQSPDPYDLSMFQGLREAGSADPSESEDRPKSHLRYYGAAAVVILMATLGYIAWHKAPGSQTPRRENQQQSVAAPNPPAGATPSTDPVPSASTTTKGTSGPAAKTIQPTSQADTAPTKAVLREASKTATQSASGSMERPIPQGNGAEELAIAQRYLEGTEGQPRDAAEAAKWLWKSTGKHNGTAPLLLADLYLKGDGVAKNCEQARILLDDAARRGIASAGERLRNLQAFGCQ